MSSLLFALVSCALAAEPRDPAELADAEIDANAMIDACRYGQCAYERRQLGEAFLIRATAAAVLRGEIDATAAANARLLAPDLAAGWGSLLPGSDRGEPEGWVRDWAGPRPPAAPAPPAPEPAPAVVREPRPPRAPSPPLLLDPEAPHVARMGLTAHLERWNTEGLVEGDVRVQVGAVGVLVAGTAGASKTRLPALAADILGTDVMSLDARSASVRLGAGPRWTRADGQELFVYGALLASANGLTWSTWEALSDDEFIADPGSRGAGGGLGVIGVAPLPHRLAVHLDGGVEYVKRSVGQSYFDGRRRERAPDGTDATDVERDALVSDPTRARLAAEVRWRISVESPLTLAAGVGGLLERGGGPRPEGVPPRSAELSVAPRIGAGLLF